MVNVALVVVEKFILFLGEAIFFKCHLEAMHWLRWLLHMLPFTLVDSADEVEGITLACLFPGPQSEDSQTASMTVAYSLVLECSLAA